MIPQDFIDQLLTRVDIVDVVERYVPLKKAGQNYMACCPFHKEKSPSFSVSPSKQFYHCFGCGAHGNAIRFVMEHAGLGFIDAVNELAGSVGDVKAANADVRSVIGESLAKPAAAAGDVGQGEPEQAAIASAPSVPWDPEAT